MKIVHTITINVTDQIRVRFSDIGFQIGNGLNTFRMLQSDPRWPSIKTIVDEDRAADLAYTLFTKAEFCAASHYRVLPAWHFGYPEPAEYFRFLSATYDLSEYCPDCGMGKRQKGPFFIKREPKWGRRNIFQLNWVFDEYFVKAESIDLLYANIAKRKRNVLSYKDGKRLGSVMQLIAPESTRLDLQPMDGVICKSCNRIKYRPVTTGYFPRVIDNSVQFARSVEEFGSGTISWNAIFCSREVFEDLSRGGISGVTFYPCEP